MSFQKPQMKEADEVYYVTPLLWNRSHKNFMKYVDDKVGKIDLSTCDEFNVYSPICYWNTHKKEKLLIEKGEYKIEVDKLDDIKYIT